MANHSFSGEDFVKESIDEDRFSDRSSPCYITVENDEGRLEHLQIQAPDECQFTIQSGFINTAFTKEEEDVPSNIIEKSGRSGSIAEVKDIVKKTSKRRIVAKGGDCNVSLYQVSKKRRQFIKDVFTTCVDMRWRYTLLAFASSFFLSWLLFAVIWYIICYVHGDFLPYHAFVPLSNHSAWLDENNHTPCVLATKDFAGAFLFSVETQHTIGYGSRQTTEECPEAIIFQCIQSVVGVMIQACMAGIVFAKLSRPKQRTNTITFSRNAVITQRNGGLYLQFRVGNIRSSHLLESHIKAVFIHHKVVTEEGEEVFFHQEDIKVGTQLDGENENLMMLWPIIVSHKIDEDSPLYNMNGKDILNGQFEIVIALDGIVEPTGNNVQARTSYLPNEIMWGYRFDNMVSYAKKQGVYAVDCSNMNSVVADDTPRISAAQIEEMKRLKKIRKASALSTKSHLSNSQGANFHRNRIQNLTQVSPVRGQRYSVVEVTNTGRFSTQPSIKNDDPDHEFLENKSNGGVRRVNSIPRGVSRRKDNDTHTLENGHVIFVNGRDLAGSRNLDPGNID